MIMPLRLFPPQQVSPGLTPRPSLSAVGARRLVAIPASVAGVDSPAFVERR